MRIRDMHEEEHPRVPREFMATWLGRAVPWPSRSHADYPEIHPSESSHVAASVVYSDALAQAERTIYPPARVPSFQACSALMRFAYLLWELPHVTAAWSKFEDGLLSAWVFMDSDKTENRREVFEAEQLVVDEYPDLDFDFFAFSEACKDAFVSGERAAERFYSRTIASGFLDCDAISE